MRFFHLFRQAFSHFRSEFTGIDDGKDVEQLIAETATLYQSVIPRRIDRETSLTGAFAVISSRPTLRLVYTLPGTSRTELDEKEFQSAMKPRLIAEARRLKRFSRILKKGGTINFCYVDGKRLEIANIALTQDSIDGTEAEEIPCRDIEKLMEPLMKDAIFIRTSASPSRSYLGGLPPDSPNLTWPRRNGRPLSLLACIDCGELPPTGDLDWLPFEGKLLFFCDLEDTPWGHDENDLGGWATVYLPLSASMVDSTAPTDLEEKFIVPKRFVTFEKRSLPPPVESVEVEALALNPLENEAYFEAHHNSYAEPPHHQLGGFAYPVQGAPLDLECQLAAEKLSGAGPVEPEDSQRLAADWSLLLQIDSDDHFMWGDAGMLYFWIRREDARARRFEKTWVLLECY
jgi:uncharacterized protein YwqG